MAPAVKKKKELPCTENLKNVASSKKKKKKEELPCTENLKNVASSMKKKKKKKKKNSTPSTRALISKNNVEATVQPIAANQTIHKEEKVAGVKQQQNFQLEIEAKGNPAKYYYSLEEQMGICMICKLGNQSTLRLTSVSIWFDHVEGYKHNLALHQLLAQFSLAQIKNIHGVTSIPEYFLSQAEFTVRSRYIFNFLMGKFIGKLKKENQEKYFFSVQSAKNYKCSVCQFNGTHIMKWMQHALARAHTVRCLSTLKKLGAECYISSYGNCLGPNPMHCSPLEYSSFPKSLKTQPAVPSSKCNSEPVKEKESEVMQNRNSENLVNVVNNSKQHGNEQQTDSNVSGPMPKFGDANQNVKKIKVVQPKKKVGSELCSESVVQADHEAIETPKLTKKLKKTKFVDASEAAIKEVKQPKCAKNQEITDSTIPTGLDGTKKEKKLKKSVSSTVSSSEISSTKNQEITNPAITTSLESTKKEKKLKKSVSSTVSSSEILSTDVSGMPIVELQQDFDTAHSDCEPRNVIVIKPIGQSSEVSESSSVAKVPSSSMDTSASTETSQSSDAVGQTANSFTDPSSKCVVRPQDCRSAEGNQVTKDAKSEKPDVVHQGTVLLLQPCMETGRQSKPVLSSASPVSDMRPTDLISRVRTDTNHMPEMPSKSSPHLFKNQPNDTSPLLLQLQERNKILNSVQDEIRLLKRKLAGTLRDGKLICQPAKECDIADYLSCENNGVQLKGTSASALVAGVSDKHESAKISREFPQPEQNASSLEDNPQNEKSLSKWTYKNWKTNANLIVCDSFQEQLHSEVTFQDEQTGTGCRSREGISNDIQEKDSSESEGHFSKSADGALQVDSKTSEEWRSPRQYLGTDADQVRLQESDSLQKEAKEHHCEFGKMDFSEKCLRDNSMSGVVSSNVIENDSPKKSPIKVKDSFEHCEIITSTTIHKKRKRDSIEEQDMVETKRNGSPKHKKRRKDKHEDQHGASIKKEDPGFKNEVQPLEDYMESESQIRLKLLVRCLGVTDTPEASSIMTCRNLMDPEAIVGFLSPLFLKGVHQLCQLLDEGVEPDKLMTLLDQVVLEDDGLYKLLKILGLEGDEDVDSRSDESWHESS